MKKVLFVSYDGMTDPLGQSQVIPYLQGLTKKGYHFTILSFEKRERFKKTGEAIRTLLQAAGIKWDPLFFTRKPPVLSKLYDNWRMKRKVIELHRKEGFSFTHCRSYVPAEAGMHLFKKYGVPYLFDMRGFWVDERVDNGQWDLNKPLFKWAYKVYKGKEKKYLQQAAHIISLTQNGKNELINNMNTASGKITVIPCCVDLVHFNYDNISKADSLALRSALGIGEGDKVLSYLGSLGGWYLSDQMLMFFKQLKKSCPEAKFLFITHDAPDIVLSSVQKNGITPSDIIIHASSREKVPLYLSLSDWSIFFIKDAYSKKASSPTKQGEIMAMGIPLICNDIGDTGHIIRQTRAGVVVPEFSDESYQACIHQMDELDQLNQKDIREGAVSFFNLEKGISLYADVYSGLPNNKL